MENSDVLRMMAEGNRQAGYDGYADKLENWAAVKEAEESAMPKDYCPIGRASCNCGWQGTYPVSGCPNCNHSFVE